MADIILAKTAPVAMVTLDRPDDLNRMTPDSMALLGRFVDDIGADDAIHAVIVTGAGDEMFSAGLLNPDIRAAMSKEQVIAFVRLANTVFDGLAALPQIVIAAINGNIMAGAVELALACDIRLAADDVTLTMPEAKWGGFPGAGGPHRLGMAVGRTRAGADRHRTPDRCRRDGAHRAGAGAASTGSVERRGTRHGADHRYQRPAGDTRGKAHPAYPPRTGLR